MLDSVPTEGCDVVGGVVFAIMMIFVFIGYLILIGGVIEYRQRGKQR